MTAAPIRRRPTPHGMVDINLSNYIEIGAVGWPTWRRFRPLTPVSLLAFLLQLVGGYGLTQAELRARLHDDLLDRRACHRWNDQAWCFCEDRS